MGEGTSPFVRRICRKLPVKNGICEEVRTVTTVRSKVFRRPVLLSYRSTDSLSKSPCSASLATVPARSRLIRELRRRNTRLFRRVAGMLYAYGEEATEVPRAVFFRSVVEYLGPDRVADVRAEFNRIIDSLEPDEKTGKRFIFSSSALGSKLAPWTGSLAHIAFWDKERASWTFGLFLWECLMNRDEIWVLYDPNISQKFHRNNHRDHRESEILGKGYFESEARA